MKNHKEDRIFRQKDLVISGLLFSIYGLILFSLDPQWVMWAGPMVLGALYVPDPPPAILFFSSPREAFQLASLFSLVSLFALGLLIIIRGERRYHWLYRFKAPLENGGFTGIAKVEDGLRSSQALKSRVLISRVTDANIMASAWTCNQLAAGQEGAATLPHGRRVVSRDLGLGGPEDLRPLRREAVPAGRNDIFPGRPQ